MVKSKHIHKHPELTGNDRLAEGFENYWPTGVFGYRLNRGKGQCSLNTRYFDRAIRSIAKRILYREQGSAGRCRF